MARRYRASLPDCYILTENQQGILLDYARQGGQVLVGGRLAEGSGLAEKLKETGNAFFVSLEGGREAYVPRFMAAFEKMYAPFSPVECGGDRIGVQRWDRDGRTWVHLLNYQYDEGEDRIRPLKELRLTLRNVAEGAPEILVPAGETPPACEVCRREGRTEVLLRNVGVYTVVAFGG